MALDLGELAVRISVDDQGLKAGLAQAKAETESARLAMVGTAAKVVGLGLAFASAGAYAVALASSVLGVVGATALVPAAVFAAGGALLALKVATGGLGEAWKATGRSAASGGGSIESSAHRAAMAQRQLRDATRGLTDAQRGALEAQTALSRARAEETERIDDLGRSVEQAAIDLSNAEQGLEDAKAGVAAASISGDPKAIREADEAYKQAELTLRVIEDRYGDLSDEQALAKKNGVEGSDAVKDALQRQLDAQYAATKAAEQLADAQYAVAQASRSAAGGIDPAAEALAKLAPSAREAVLQARALAPSWTAVGRVGQQNMFAHTAEDLRRISTAYLPLGTQWMGRMGSAFNVAIRQMAGLATTRDTLRDVGILTDSTATFTDRLARSLRPVVNGILQFAAVGATFLPKIGDSTLSIAERFERWAIASRETGKTQVWIQTALDTLTQIGRIGGNVVGFVRAFFHAGDDGGSTLDGLEKGTAAMERWMQSEDGQRTVSTLLGHLRDVLGSIGPIAADVADHGDALNDTLSLSGVVVGFLADHLGAVASLLPVLIGGYILMKAAQVGANVAAVASLPVDLARITSNFTLSAAMRANTAAILGNTAVEKVGLVSKARALVVGAAMKVATGIQTAANWLLASSTWATLGPILLVIAAVALLVAGVIYAYTHWAWFRKAIDNVKNGMLILWAGLKIIGAWFAGPFTDFFVNGWKKVTGFASSSIDFYRGLPGKIKNAFLTVADIITAPFKAAFNAIARLWNNSVGQLSFSVPSWVPQIGGNGFSMPKLPLLAKGGVMEPRPGGTLALLAEAGKREIATPEDLMRRIVREETGGGHTPMSEMNLEAHVYIGTREITDIVKVEIKQKDRAVKRKVGAGAGRR